MVGCTAVAGNGQQPNTPRQGTVTGGTRTLIFPKNSIGSFCFVKVGPRGELKESKELSPAQGAVKVPIKAKIQIKTSWYGAEDLSWLAKLKPDDVAALDLRNMPVTDEQLKYVGQMTGLESLRLDDTDVSDAGLLAVSHLTNLVGLYLTKTSITGTGLKAIVGCRSLEWIDLGRNALTDASVANLKALNNLRVLILCNTGISDQALSSVGAIKSLEYLELNHNRKITDAGIAMLKLNNLVSLTLVDTHVTLKGLLLLKQLSSLKLVSFDDNHLSKAELEKLKAAMPTVWLRGHGPPGKPKVDTEIFAPLH